MPSQKNPSCISLSRIIAFKKPDPLVEQWAFRRSSTVLFVAVFLANQKGASADTHPTKEVHIALVQCSDQRLSQHLVQLFS